MGAAEVLSLSVLCSWRFNCHESHIKLTVMQQCVDGSCVKFCVQSAAAQTLLICWKSEKLWYSSFSWNSHPQKEERFRQSCDWFLYWCENTICLSLSNERSKAKLTLCCCPSVWNPCCFYVYVTSSQIDFSRKMFRKSTELIHMWQWIVWLLAD